MKRSLSAVFLVLVLVLLPAWPVSAITFPKAQGFVSDFAGLIAPADRAALEDRLSTLEKETSAEVAVVTVSDLGGTTIEDYASQLFEAWGIGKKDQDNGVLFIVSLAEHKARIEVGYGLEPIITDARAGRILDEKVIPEFKNGDYSTGILQGAAAIEEYIRAGTPPGPLEDNPVRSALGDNMPLLTWLGIITIYLMGFMARSKSIWLGGIWGVVVGTILGLTMGNPGSTLLLAGACGGLGALLDFILSRNYKERAGKGMGTGWFSSGGGFSGGGGSFGGFSGGSSGGGGASRGW